METMTNIKYHILKSLWIIVNFIFNSTFPQTVTSVEIQKIKKKELWSCIVKVQWNTVGLIGYKKMSAYIIPYPMEGIFLVFGVSLYAGEIGTGIK